MQSVPFALTKIQPPRARAGLIARPALEQRLGEALDSMRLVLLSAPAGFGKTAALSRQLGLLPGGTAVAWVAADEDDDLARLAHCLVAAIEPLDPPWRASPDALIAALDGRRHSRQALVDELLNALAATEAERGLIVIDDLHRIADPALFEFLDALIERLPARWCLLLAGRVDPPLAIPKLRARGELAEFRQADLSFSGDEVRALVRQRERSLAEAELRTLQDRTQGWAAGLSLALNDLSGGKLPGGSMRERHLFDYLASEVLDGLEPTLRAFLVRCSVLPELTAARCRVVAGVAHAARLLDEVERRGLFVSVRGDPAEAGGELALCLHDLFRDCLEDRLRRDHADELPALLRRAADTETDPARRIGYLARAGAWAEAEDALFMVGPSLIAAAARSQVLRLIDLFPVTQRLGSPRLQFLRGLCAWVQLDWSVMAEAMQHAAGGYAAAGHTEAAERARALLAVALSGGGRVADSVRALGDLHRSARDDEARTLSLAAHAWHALDGPDLDRVGERYGELVDRLERSSNPLLWYQCFPRSVYIGLPGTQAPLQRFVDGALSRFGDAVMSLRAVAHGVQAWLHFWAGRWDAALEAHDCAGADLRWIGRPLNLRTTVDTFGALVLALRGDAAAALEAAEALQRDFAATSRDPRHALHLHFRFWALRIADLVDDRAALRRIAATLPVWQDGEPSLMRDQTCTVAARIALAEGRFDEACRGYEAALALGHRIDCFGQAAEIRLRLAHSRWRQGDAARASAALRPLFQQVQAQSGAGAVPGYVLLGGARILEELAQADWRGQLDGVERERLRRWAAGAAACRPSTAARLGAVSSVQATTTAARPTGSDASPVLSEREREVLARIARGDSNKLIAREFELSPHTVKRHVANILGKLGHHSRGQAAAWYRANA